MGKSYFARHWLLGPSRIARHGQVSDAREVRIESPHTLWRLSVEMINMDWPTCHSSVMHTIDACGTVLIQVNQNSLVLPAKPPMETTLT